MILVCWKCLFAKTYRAAAPRSRTGPVGSDRARPFDRHQPTLHALPWCRPPQPDHLSNYTDLPECQGRLSEPVGGKSGPVHPYRTEVGGSSKVDLTVTRFSATAEPRQLTGTSRGHACHNSRQDIPGRSTTPGSNDEILPPPSTTAPIVGLAQPLKYELGDDHHAPRQRKAGRTAPGPKPRWEPRIRAPSAIGDLT